MYINVTKTVTGRPLATPLQKLGAAFGILICGIALGVALFLSA